jgi:hypothetical protein
VYANGDVAFCESLPPLGNIRQTPFPEIWHSPKAKQVRASIAAKECYCTNEIFMWPSITFQPLHLVRALYGSKFWRKPQVLQKDERADYCNCAVGRQAKDSQSIIEP